MLVHHIDYSSHRDLRIKCSQYWTTPLWGNPNTDAPGIYFTDEGLYYSFDKEKVTCEKCQQT